MHSFPYETDALEIFETVKEWKKNISIPGWLLGLPSDCLTRNSAGLSEREQRARRREEDKLFKAPLYTYSEAQLRRSFGDYVGYYLDQAMLCCSLCPGELGLHHNYLERSLQPKRDGQSLQIEATCGHRLR